MVHNIGSSCVLECDRWLFYWFIYLSIDSFLGWDVLCEYGYHLLIGLVSQWWYTIILVWIFLLVWHSHRWYGVGELHGWCDWVFEWGCIWTFYFGSMVEKFVSVSVTSLSCLVWLWLSLMTGVPVVCCASAALMSSRFQRYDSSAGPRYHPSIACGAHESRVFGLSWTRTLVPGGASGVLL